MTIRQLSTRVVYQNPWMTVREDEIERNNGTRGIYGVIEKCDSAIVIAIEDDKVYLVEQFSLSRWDEDAGVPAGEPGAQ
jgi:hypothetical protein